MALTPAQQQEIERLGRLWNEAKSQEEKTSLNQQANAIRSQAGLKSGVDYDPVSGAALKSGIYSGAGNYSASGVIETSPEDGWSVKERVNRGPGGVVTQGGAVTSQPTEPSAPQLPWYYATGDEGATTVKASTQSDSLLQMIQDMLNQSGSQQQALIAQLQEQAQMQAEAVANAKRQGLDQLIASLKGQQESGLRSIAGAVEDGKTSLEDKYFQNWLATRQQMANRGLAGSGIASDQDTRLLLSKQRDLAGIHRDAARNRFDLESRIGNQLEQAYNALANINTGDIANEQFSELFKTGQGTLTDQARIYADLFKTLLPYDRATVKDLLGNQLDWAKYGNDQQGIELDKAKLLIEQGKVDLDRWKTFGYMPDPTGSGKLVPTAQMSQFQQEQALAEAKARGYFVTEDGSIIPTEDRRHNEAIENLQGKELVARMSQWAQENSLAAQRINLNAQEFAHKMDYDQALLKKAEAELQASNDRTQLSGLRTQLSSVDGLISKLLSEAEYNPAVKQSPEYLTLIQQRDGLMSSISSLFSAQ